MGSLRFMIELRNVAKVYRRGRTEVRALRGVSLTVDRAEFVAIIGPSGAGKSTLLNVIGCLDKPTTGIYILDKQEVGSMSEDELAAVRSRKIGFVFQTFNLLPLISALKNVEAPLAYRGTPQPERHRRAIAALEWVGLAHRLDHKPQELSAGEQQRVAIARALISDPAILVADEPTGNLDPSAARETLALFQDFNRRGTTIVLVTHDVKVAEHSGRILVLREGWIADQKVHFVPRSALTAVSEEDLTRNSRGMPAIHEV